MTFIFLRHFYHFYQAAVAIKTINLLICCCSFDLFCPLLEHFLFVEHFNIVYTIALSHKIGIIPSVPIPIPNLNYQYRLALTLNVYTEITFDDVIVLCSQILLISFDDVIILCPQRLFTTFDDVIILRSQTLCTTFDDVIILCPQRLFTNLTRVLAAGCDASTEIVVEYDVTKEIFTSTVGDYLNVDLSQVLRARTV